MAKQITFKIGTHSDDSDILVDGEHLNGITDIDIHVHGHAGSFNQITLQGIYRGEPILFDGYLLDRAEFEEYVKTKTRRKFSSDPEPQ